MPIDFDALCNAVVTETFGESMIYQSFATGTTFNLQGVFVDAYSRSFENGEGGVGWLTTGPSVGVRLSDCPIPPAKNDLIRRVSAGKTYLVFEAHADGLGWINLLLKATS